MSKKIDTIRLHLEPWIERAFEADEQYIVTVDYEQNDKVTVTGGFTIYTPQDWNNNLRTALPRFGTIYRAIGKDCKFKPGDTIICTHFAFVDEGRNTTEFFREGNVKYHKVTNDQILGVISEGELIPNSEILFCEPIKDKLYDTDLELPDDLVDYRRDIGKIYKTPDKWKEEFPEGKYAVLDEGGDYLFEWSGKTFMAVTLYLWGAIGCVDTPEWRNKEVWRHQKDHSTTHYT